MMDTDPQVKVVIPESGGKAGHPLLLNGEVLPFILSYSGEQGMKGAYKSLPEGSTGRIIVEDEGAVTDADEVDSGGEVLIWDGAACDVEDLDGFAVGAFDHDTSFVEVDFDVWRMDVVNAAAVLVVFVGELSPIVVGQPGIEATAGDGDAVDATDVVERAFTSGNRRIAIGETDMVEVGAAEHGFAHGVERPVEIDVTQVVVACTESTFANFSQ